MKITDPDTKKAYELDLSEAIRTGACKEIPAFRVGDIFQSNSSRPVLIVQADYRPPTYNFAGLDGLRLFSNHPKSLTHDEMVSALIGYERKGNINDLIRQKIEEYK